jgi:hypothetical protein
MLVNIVSEHLANSHHSNIELSRIIRTPAWYTPPFGSLSTWTAWGINFEDNPDNGVFWKKGPVPGDPSKEIHYLRTFQVVNPSIYPLLGDSSDDRGQPHIRMSSVNQGGRSFAMRYNKKGPIFTLDGSTKMIGEDQMEAFGLKTGYVFKPSNPATDPVDLVVAF